MSGFASYTFQHSYRRRFSKTLDEYNGTLHTKINVNRKSNII